MITSETPEQQNLRYLASLLCPSDKTYNEVKKPESIDDNNIIECMDHHGVTMLLLENGCLNDEVMSKLASRKAMVIANSDLNTCLLYTSPSPRDQRGSRMPSSA